MTGAQVDMDHKWVVPLLEEKTPPHLMQKSMHEMTFKELRELRDLLVHI